LEILAVVVEGGVVAPLFFWFEILCKTKEKSLDESQKLDLKPPCKTKEENKN
jgi:hypothetical protein